MDERPTIRQLLEKALHLNGESMSDVRAMNFTEEALDCKDTDLQFFYLIVGTVDNYYVLNPWMEVPAFVLQPKDPLDIFQES